MRDIADTGLNICLELFNNIAVSEAAIANAFYQTYLLSILQDVFFVLTDSDHKSGELSHLRVSLKIQSRDQFATLSN